MKNHWRKLLAGMLLLAACISSIPLLASAHSEHAHNKEHAKHVLLLSVDGLHQQDLANFVKQYPKSALAQLGKQGLTYTNASTAKPSDSFPGLLSMTTGGSPRVTGVYYDDSYDRKLSAPGSKCATKGTEVVYDESIDKNPAGLDAGGGIDVNALPLDPAKGCTPVYPHSFLRVNTIFEVARSAGLRTAWSDKHPAYELLNGPSGKGVQDLYTPEIAANSTTDSVTATEAYDDLKVKAILNEIAGKDHSGTKKVGVPALFGMNFQAVSVGQKLPTGGYTTAGAPSVSLLNALTHVDQSIGAMVSALRKEGLLSSTVIIVTAKHGQAPIDPQKRLIVSSKLIPATVNAVAPGLLAQATQDDIALLWLTDQSKTGAVVKQLWANKAQLHIKNILYGKALAEGYGRPDKDSRTPDIIVEPELGVIYTKLTATKIAEHGGFSKDDINVALLLSNADLEHEQINTPVQTTQIAPSILRLLGLNPERLQAVQKEHTRVLPDIGLR